MSNADLAAPELASIDVEGTTRATFLVRATLAAGAVYGGGMVAPFVRKALAQSNGGDIEILNFALTMEYLEANFYDIAKKHGSTLGKDVRDLSQLLADHENQHAKFLIATIKEKGGKPVPPPAVNFGNVFGNRKAFLDLAERFEDTGVGAYNGAGPLLASNHLLAAAGTIVQTEGRHAAAIRDLNGKPTAVDAFDYILKMDEVRRIVRPYVGS